MRGLVVLAVLYFLSLSAVHAVREITIGMALLGDRDMDPDHLVYDGRNSVPVMPKFREKECRCTSCQDCSHSSCHLEGISIDSRFFYVQLTEESDLRVREPNITVTPFCPSKHQLKISTRLRQTGIRHVEDYSTVEMDFECNLSSEGPTRYDIPIFEVEVALPIYNEYRRTEETIRWSFRKACVAQTVPASGLTIQYIGKKHQPYVVRDGKTQEGWAPGKQDLYDVGFDPNDRDFKFEIMYLPRQSTGPLSYKMVQPEFDRGIIQKVWLKGPEIDKTMTINSGSTEELKVHVRCQSHPRREDRPADVVVTMVGLSTASDVNIKDVQFKFMVECPYHGNRISPLGVLGIVFGVYLVLACVGGYSYNTRYTPRRGVAAVPMLSSILSLVTKRKPAYFPDVQDDDGDVLAEEILASKYSKRRDEYGAI